MTNKSFVVKCYHTCAEENGLTLHEQTSLSLLAAPVLSSVAGGVLAACCDVEKGMLLMLGCL